MPGEKNDPNSKMFSLGAVAALLSGSSYHLLTCFPELCALTCFLLEQPNTDIFSVNDLKKMLPDAQAASAAQYPEHAQAFDDIKQACLNDSGGESVLRGEVDKYLSDYPNGEFELVKPSVYQQRAQLPYNLQAAFLLFQQQREGEVQLPPSTSINRRG